MVVNVDDFRYMWRGKQLQTLVNRHAELLAPINIRGKGRDRALLLLHGFGSSPAVFRTLLSSLSWYDAIICPALPGHGLSLHAFTHAKAQDWLLAAEEACESLINDYQKVDVMGLSLGGLLGCHLSQRFPLHHLYLLAPALALQINVKLSLTCARILHKLGFNKLRNKAGNLCSDVYSEIAYRQLPLTTIIEILSLVEQFKFAPPTCPTDLFLGRYDKVINTKRVATYFENIPQCNIHWLAHSAHVLPLDRDVDDIIACLQKTREHLG